MDGVFGDFSNIYSEHLVKSWRTEHPNMNQHNWEFHKLNRPKQNRAQSKLENNIIILNGVRAYLKNIYKFIKRVCFLRKVYDLTMYRFLPRKKTFK